MTKCQARFEPPHRGTDPGCSRRRERAASDARGPRRTRGFGYCTLTAAWPVPVRSQSPDRPARASVRDRAPRWHSGEPQQCRQPARGRSRARRGTGRGPDSSRVAIRSSTAIACALSRRASIIRARLNCVAASSGACSAALRYAASASSRRPLLFGELRQPYPCRRVLRIDLERRPELLGRLHHVALRGQSHRKIVVPLGDAQSLIDQRLKLLLRLAPLSLTAIEGDQVDASPYPFRVGGDGGLVFLDRFRRRRLAAETRTRDRNARRHRREARARAQRSDPRPRATVSRTAALLPATSFASSIRPSRRAPCRARTRRRRIPGTAARRRPARARRRRRCRRLRASARDHSVRAARTGPLVSALVRADRAFSISPDSNSASASASRAGIDDGEKFSASLRSWRPRDNAPIASRRARRDRTTRTAARVCAHARRPPTAASNCSQACSIIPSSPTRSASSGCALTASSARAIGARDTARIVLEIDVGERPQLALCATRGGHCQCRPAAASPTPRSIKREYTKTPVRVPSHRRPSSVVRNPKSG